MRGCCVRDGSPKGRDSGPIYFLLFFLAGVSPACCESPTSLAGERPRVQGQKVDSRDPLLLTSSQDTQT